MSDITLTGTVGSDTIVAPIDISITLYEIQALDGHDIVYGGKYDDLIIGGRENYYDFGFDILAPNPALADDDTLFGRRGNDTLVDSEGNDRLFGGAGNDILLAGATYIKDGIDTAEILYGYSAVYGLGQDVLFGGLGDDVLYGGEDNDSLYGGAGNDTLFGGNGDDIFYDLSTDGEQADSFDGGLGLDTVVYKFKAAPEGVTGLIIDMTDTANSSSFAKNDIYTGIETLFATNRNDVIYAADFMAVFGRDGGDTLVDGAGLEVLSGGAGYDIFKMLANDFQIDRIVDFTQGEDRIDLSLWGAIDFAQLTFVQAGNDVLVSFGAETVQVDMGWDTVAGTTALTADSFVFGIGGDGVVTGSENNDVLTLNFTEADRDMLDHTGNTVVALGGRDLVIAGDGDDTVYGGDGNDRITGGAGNDVLYGEMHHDRINGGAGDDLIYGGDGRDRISGGEGLDELYGGLGNDVFVASDGGDSFYGGDGLDTVTYAAASKGMVINTLLPELNTFMAQGDTYDSIERLYGSKYADIITSDTSEIQGRGGDDVLQDGDGAQRLSGGMGHDVFRLVANDGSLDRITDFSLAEDTIDLRLWGVTDFADLTIVERTDGSGNLQGDLMISFGSELLRVDRLNTADIALLNAGHFILATAAQDGTIAGSDNLDRISLDYIDVDGERVDHSGNIIMTFAGNDRIHAGNGDDTIYGGNNRDRINGGGGDDMLFGEAGRDRFIASSGSDQFYGGTGRDAVTYTGSETGLTIDMGNGANSTGIAFGDQYDSIERLFATNQNDIIYARNIEVYGRDGDDHIFDGTGHERIYGGSGADVFHFVAADGKADRLSDFELGIDIIDLSAWGVTDIGELNIRERTARDGTLKGDLLIQFGQEKIRLDGLYTADIDGFTSDSFIFAAPEII